MKLKNIALTGQKARKTYQRTLPTNPKQDYYFIHRNTGTTEPLIIEYGFMLIVYILLVSNLAA